jgi:hypothetical protein
MDASVLPIARLDATTRSKREVADLTGVSVAGVAR